MMAMRFKRTKFIDPEELLRFTVAEFLPRAGIFVTREAKMRAPVAKGQLQRSIDYIVEPELVRIGTEEDYAPDVEYGTRPHVITVKNAKVLTDGESFFGRRVNHPGTVAQPFLRPSVDENRGKLVSMFRQIMARFKKGMTRGR